MRKLLPMVALATALSLPAGAQCVMCYRTAHAQNDARSRVLDMGILILGAPPFLILAGFIAFVFSKDKQFRTSNQASDESESV
jgi:ABC-type methionine transport system permease subunit